MTLDDVARVSPRATFVPARATLVAVGDAPARSRCSMLTESAFGGWGTRAGADARTPRVGVAAANRQRTRSAIVDRPGPPQSELRIGHVGVPREHARLPRAADAEHGARRSVRQPHQHEPARGQGLHLRRRGRLRLPPRPGPVRAADQRAVGGYRRRDPRSARRDDAASAARGRSRARSSSSVAPR